MCQKRLLRRKRTRVLKDNLRVYWHLLKSILVVLRVMAFEKFTALFFFFYLLSVLSVALVLSLVHWGAGVVTVFLALLMFTKILAKVEFLKRSLIRKNDRVEYADPSETDDKLIFKKADIVLKMRLDEVEKTKLITSELMQDNEHFYLVRAGEEVSVIAYDWIIGLSPEILEPEEDEDLL